MTAHHEARLLRIVEDLYGELPRSQTMMIGEVSRMLRESGMHGVGKAGAGITPLIPRPFDPARGDNPSQVKLNYTNGDMSDWKNWVVVDTEREIKNRAFMWVDSTESMNFSSKLGVIPTKWQSAMGLTLAMARKMLDQGDGVAFSREGLYTSLTQHRIGNPGAAGLTVLSGASFGVDRRIPHGSTFTLLGDFHDYPDALRMFDELQQRRDLTVCVVAIADPMEVTFDLPEDMEVYGCEGEHEFDDRLPLIFNKAMQPLAQQIYQDEVKENLRVACEERGFSFYFQRTDLLGQENCLRQIMAHHALAGGRRSAARHTGSMSGLDLAGIR